MRVREDLADFEAAEAAASERAGEHKRRERERQAAQALIAHIASHAEHITAHAAELAEIRTYSKIVREALEVISNALEGFADMRDKALPEIVEALRAEMLTECAAIRDELIAKLDTKTYGVLTVEPDAKVAELALAEVRRKAEAGLAALDGRLTSLRERLDALASLDRRWAITTLAVSLRAVEKRVGETAGLGERVAKLEEGLVAASARTEEPAEVTVPGYSRS